MRLVYGLFLLFSFVLSSCADESHKEGVDRSDPEDVVRYFYQSKVDGNDKWKEVIPPIGARHHKLVSVLLEYPKFKIIKFKILGTQETKSYGPDFIYVVIKFTIEYNGKKDSGVDEVTLQNKNGIWTIVELPL